MLCAVSSDRDRKHEEARKFPQVKNEELTTGSRVRSLSSRKIEQCPIQSMSSKSFTQWKRKSSNSSRSQCGKDSFHPENVNQVTKQVENPRILCTEKDLGDPGEDQASRESTGSASRGRLVKVPGVTRRQVVQEQRKRNGLNSVSEWKKFASRRQWQQRQILPIWSVCRTRTCL